MEVKKAAYMKLVESKNEDEKRTNMERYKTIKKRQGWRLRRQHLNTCMKNWMSKVGKISCRGSPRREKGGLATYEMH